MGRTITNDNETEQENGGMRTGTGVIACAGSCLQAWVKLTAID